MAVDEDYAAFAAIRKRSDLIVLVALRDGEAKTQATIAEATGLNQSTVSRSLKSLVADGYLQRVQDGHRVRGTWFDCLERLRSEVDAHEDALRRVMMHVGGQCA